MSKGTHSTGTCSQVALSCCAQRGDRQSRGGSGTPIYWLNFTPCYDSVGRDAYYRFAQAHPEACRREGVVEAWVPPELTEHPLQDKEVVPLLPLERGVRGPAALDEKCAIVATVYDHQRRGWGPRLVDPWEDEGGDSSTWSAPHLEYAGLRTEVEFIGLNERQAIAEFIEDIRDDLENRCPAVQTDPGKAEEGGGNAPASGGGSAQDPPAAAEEIPPVLNALESNIIRTLGLVDRRLTTEPLAHKVNHKPCGAFKVTLATMVRRNLLVNVSDPKRTKGRGYGLPEWSES